MHIYIYNPAYSIIQEEISDEEVQKLELLCQVWGFVKYHHPEVAAGNFDMDEELIALIPLIEDAENQTEAIKVLSEWTDKFGEITEFMDESNYPAEEYIHVKPDFIWMKKLSKINTPNFIIIFNARTRTFRKFY